MVFSLIASGMSPALHLSFTSVTLSVHIHGCLAFDKRTQTSCFGEACLHLGYFNPGLQTDGEGGATFAELRSIALQRHIHTWSNADGEACFRFTYLEPWPLELDVGLATRTTRVSKVRASAHLHIIMAGIPTHRVLRDAEGLRKSTSSS